MRLKPRLRGKDKRGKLPREKQLLRKQDLKRKNGSYLLPSRLNRLASLQKLKRRKESVVKLKKKLSDKGKRKRLRRPPLPLKKLDLKKRSANCLLRSRLNKPVSPLKQKRRRGYNVKLRKLRNVSDRLALLKKLGSKKSDKSRLSVRRRRRLKLTIRSEELRS